MSTPSRPLTRQSSRAEIDTNSTSASNDDVNTNTPLAGNGPGGSQEQATEKTPRVMARPGSSAGTWVPAATKQGPVSTSHLPTTHGPHASEPTLSPRGGMPELPQAPGSNSSSTLAPAPTPETYIKTKVPGDQIPEELASVLRAGYQGMKSVPHPTNPARIIQVPVFNIPPKQIARLLIGLDTNFFQQAPTTAHKTNTLRDGCGIVNFQVNSGMVLDHINVIEDILLPFMRKTFDTKESEQARLEVRERFDAFVTGPHNNLLNFGKEEKITEATSKNLIFRDQFEPVLQPLNSFILGDKYNLESSQLTPDFKVFLKEIVKSFYVWHEKKNIEPSDLKNMIQNGLIGLLFIRGLLPAWGTKFAQDVRHPEQLDRAWSKSKQTLLKLLSHHTSIAFEDFVLGIIANTEGSSKAFEDYFQPIKRGAEMRRKEALTAGLKKEKNARTLTRSPTVSGSASSTTEKKSKIGQLIQGLVSPRKKEPTSSSTLLVSPRNTKASASERIQSSEGVLLRKAPSRKAQVLRGKKRDLDQYLHSIKLPVYDAGYIRWLNNAIGQRGQYQIFQYAPAAFCLVQLETYLEDLQKEGAKVSDELKQNQNFLFNVAQTEREAAEKEAGKSTKNELAKSSNASTAKAPTAATASVPSLDLGELARSPFAEEEPMMPLNLDGFAKRSFAEKSDEADEADEVSASSATEPSDSTDVETESSQEAATVNGTSQKNTAEKAQQ